MLRKVVIALLLLVAPFAQARVAFACAMMGGAMAPACCCDAPCGERSCDDSPRVVVEQQACCMPVLAAQAAAVGAETSAPTAAVAQRIAPDCALLPAPARAAQPPHLLTRARATCAPPDARAGSRTYLILARLRL